MTGQPFLCSYGGGHANIIVPVAKELARRGRHPSLLGFTTAVEVFRRAGLDPLDASSLIEEQSDQEYLEALEPFVPASGHPDITDAQTQAYFLAGFRDLAERLGIECAIQAVEAKGRLAFEPVLTFRRYFEKAKPSAVVTTTSPRFELAAIKAARSLGIPSIAIGDMFLIQEREWICGNGYADHLVVISDGVGDMLREYGLGQATKIHVLGNPAFDSLAESTLDTLKENELRTNLGWQDNTVVLWALGGSDGSTIGRRLIGAQEAGEMLDSICRRHPRLRFILRPHPNFPIPDLNFEHGVVDGEMKLEDAMNLVDVVCAEVSTVGFQASLRGIPTICYKYADYVLYPEFGWASAADNPAELEKLLLNGGIATSPESARGMIGKATGAVVDLIEDIVA
ncbi:hypothetical protein [Altererythrobacter sp. MF3-039]|uniref:hypothetical protein n=1 Tax=Altererythrobacter sp. MF3-039 TaxID=3252901 RepID=UPI00390C831F